MSLSSNDDQLSLMVILFWVGLLICIAFLGLNVLFDLVDLTGIF